MKKRSTKKSTTKRGVKKSKVSVRKSVTKSMIKKRQSTKKPVTLGDLHRRHGGNWGDFPADMPASEWLKNNGMPAFGRVFKLLVG